MERRTFGGREPIPPHGTGAAATLPSPGGSDREDAHRELVRDRTGHALHREQLECGGKTDGMHLNDRCPPPTPARDFPPDAGASPA